MREPRREDPAESFGPYLIFECLGRGGMATVHRAKQTGIEGFERPVALKRMLPWLTSDPEFVKSFVREARLAALLRHTNIVQTYDLGKVDAVYYIAMELVAGRDLRELLRHAHNVVGPPPPQVTINLLFQVCDALDYAHTFRDEQGRTLGLVHRDISPANVIVADDGTAKIVDFGVAKGSTATLATMSGMLKGKFAYMAPEMLQGQIDGRCDLFAVGVVAWELLTARPLFAGGDDMEILQRVTTWDPPAPSSVNPAVPRELDAWVAMALSKQPQRRFQSAAQMRAGLELVARTPAMRASAADVAAWMGWAFAQKPGTALSPAPPVPAPAPAMPMPMASMASTVLPPAPIGGGAPPAMPLGMGPPMAMGIGAPIGGADSVAITIDDSTNVRAAVRHTPQVLAASPGVTSGARTMMLDDPAMIPAAQPDSQAGMATLPGTGHVKPMPPPTAAPAPAGRPHSPSRGPAGPNMHATMIGTAIPAAVAAAASAQHRGPMTAPPPVLAPGTMPPPSQTSSAARTVMFDGAPPQGPAGGHGASSAGMTLPSLPPGASGDPGQAPAPYPAAGYPAAYPSPHGAPHGAPAPQHGAPPQQHGAPPAQGAPAGYPAGYPAGPQAYPGAPPPHAPAWGAGTPGGQPAPAPMPSHHGGPIGGFAPGQHQAGPGGQGPSFNPGFGAGGQSDLPVPKPSGGNGVLIAIVLMLCAGAAVGGYFIIQHLG